jgi:hypothetical protein
MRRARRYLRFGTVLGLLVLDVRLVRAQEDALAQRFRPYIKTTLAGGRDEPFHPANWQWIAGESNLFRGDTLLVTSNQLKVDLLALVNPMFDGNFSVNGAGLTDPKLELRLIGVSAMAGEMWSAVIHEGHGIYAHVENINPSLVNIEYTIVWPRNASSVSNHDGDLTTIVVVYDRIADRLARVTYSIHGCVLKVFQLNEPRLLSYAALTGKSESFEDATLEVARIDVPDQNAASDSTSLCAVTDSEQHLFLASDPDTHLYEHPVVFAENSAHELWPNDSGFLSGAPAHAGDGVSFLPDRVQVLGTIAAPRPEHFPFVLYNGKFGNDPQAIALHKTWFWPDGRDNQRFISADRFSDLEPYRRFSNLLWPPAPSSSTSNPIFVNSRDAQSPNRPFDGTEQNPILGLALAYSVTPRGTTLSLAAGGYLEPALFAKPMVLVARGGAAILGRKTP